MPDIGQAPPPPVDVAAQLRPSGPGGAVPQPPGSAPNLQSIMAGLTGGGPGPGLNSDLTPKILQVEPLLAQIAREVPALGPDVDRLNVELKARMGGLPAALAASGPPPMTPGAGGPNAGGPPTPIGGPSAAPAPVGSGGPGPGPLPSQAPPALPPNPVAGKQGAMDTAMQLEIQLPDLGKEDPTLMPYVQGFIAKMRQEVPKVVEGDTEAIAPPTQAAPTEGMLSKIPVSY